MPDLFCANALRPGPLTCSGTGKRVADSSKICRASKAADWSGSVGISPGTTARFTHSAAWKTAGKPGRSLKRNIPAPAQAISHITGRQYALSLKMAGAANHQFFGFHITWQAQPMKYPETLQIDIQQGALARNSQSVCTELGRASPVFGLFNACL